MLKQLTITLDTSDPLQAQLLVEYLAASYRIRFARSCMMLGFLAATGAMPAGAAQAGEAAKGADGAAAIATPPGRRQGKVIGAKLFGVD